MKWTVATETKYVLVVRGDGFDAHDLVLRTAVRALELSHIGHGALMACFSSSDSKISESVLRKGATPKSIGTIRRTCRWKGASTSQRIGTDRQLQNLS
jgi:hypothetical protein